VHRGHVVGAIPLVVMHRVVAIEVLLWLWGARGRHGLNVQLWLGVDEGRSSGREGGRELRRHQYGCWMMISVWAQLLAEVGGMWSRRDVATAAAAMVSAREGQKGVRGLWGETLEQQLRAVAWGQPRAEQGSTRRTERITL
jgi:hypothetical protein